MLTTQKQKDGYDYAKAEHSSGRKSLEKLDIEVQTGMAFDPSDFEYGMKEYLSEVRKNVSN